LELGEVVEVEAEDAGGVAGDDGVDLGWVDAVELVGVHLL
jgi:hypothetical protein